MLNSGYVEITGIIRTDVEVIISKYNVKYGIILVEKVNEHSNPKQEHRSFRFYVFIWNYELLNRYLHSLKYGKRVVVRGEFEIIGETYYKYAWFSKLVVNVRKEDELIILDGI
ncbi:hypothetical protein I862_04170 [endosymbiont of Acanthamoeba sp. UWC8]|uniref:hypothetical protein n=1 Tax=endosymbiont of Acanthamoeba sp. UWC8 TaxID=86106 RepID=UPI0004D1077C|nr:hypothetical protein [endosymbiont of Acanthamoeba sp. UWC8]AIF81394.1 hypothetical protein I862_04170 [endosymbiont of Acanthamoeba sp. UWC8]